MHRSLHRAAILSLLSREKASPASTRLLAHTRRLRIPSLLAPPLLALLDIPPASAATTLAELDDPRQNRRTSRNPHESEHLRSNARADVDLSHRRDRVLHDNEQDRRNDRADCDEQGSEEGEDHDHEGDPTAEHGGEDQEHHEEVDTGAREEEAEHPVRDDLDQIEDVVNVGWQSD